MSKHKSLYSQKRWQRLRYYQLQADPLCKLCQGLGRLTSATVVDHIKPHKGDDMLFHDPNNLQSLCKPCHDKAKQIVEVRGYLIGGDDQGIPIDPTHHWRVSK